MKAPADDARKDSNRFQIPWYLEIKAEICGLCGSPEPGSGHFAPVASKDVVPGGMVVKLYRVPLCEPCAGSLKGNPEERIRRTPDLVRFIQEHVNLERARACPAKGSFG